MAMKNHFLDPNKNRYPGLNLANQPGFKAMQKQNEPLTNVLAEAELKSSYELRVQRIPIEMTEEGLRNLFSKQGQVIDLFLAKPRRGSPEGVRITLFLTLIRKYATSNAIASFLLANYIFFLLVVV